MDALLVDGQLIKYVSCSPYTEFDCNDDVSPSHLAIVKSINLEQLCLIGPRHEMYSSS